MRYSLALFLVVLGSVALSGCSVNTPAPQAELTAPPTQEETQTVETPMNQNIPPVTELQMVDSLVGTGAEAMAGKKITVHYTGKLMDGTKFDSSLDRDEPFTFILGAGQVIEGWDQGFAGMKVGGKRSLLIPSVMGYGEYGAPPVIPPNADLQFDVELLRVE